MASIEIRRGADRAVTATDWVRSRHSFSFGSHYDPANTSFGLLLAVNADVVQPGAGYRSHPHAHTEILSWVLDGALAHEDSTGRSSRVEPGVLQYLSAGSGISHAERSASAGAPVEFVQMWLAPGTSGGQPRYAAVGLADRLATGRLTLAAAGSRPAPVTLNQPAAELYIGRLPAGGSTVLPAGRFVHLHLVRGSGELDGRSLVTGDAARITGGSGLQLRTEEPAEVLVWVMSDGLPTVAASPDAAG